MAAFNPISSMMGAGVNPFTALWSPILNMALPQPKPSAPASLPTAPATPTAPVATVPTPSTPVQPDPAVPSTGAARIGGPTSGSGESQLIQTGLRGVLDPKPSWLARKTLLGE